MSVTFDPAEIWMPVPGFDKYEVSNLGRVKSHSRGAPRILRPGPTNYGHLSVVLGRGNTRMVHALVLTAFVGPRPPGADCRHLDGDPTNNHLANLRWGSRTENILDAVAHGTWASDKRRAGWASPKLVTAAATARAALSREALLASLQKARDTRWGKK